MFRKGSVLLLAAAIPGITGGCDENTGFFATFRQLLPQAGTLANAPDLSNPMGTTQDGGLGGSRDPGDLLSPTRQPDRPDASPPDSPDPTDPSGPNEPTGPEDPPEPDGLRLGPWQFILTHAGSGPVNNVVEFEVKFVVAQDARGALIIDSLEYDTVLACDFPPPDLQGFTFISDVCDEDAPIINRRGKACLDSDFSFEINFLRPDFARMEIRSLQPDCPDWGDPQAIKVDVRPVG